MNNLTFNEYQSKTEETAIYQQSINTYVDSLGILNKEQADT